MVIISGVPIRIFTVCYLCLCINATSMTNSYIFFLHQSHIYVQRQSFTREIAFVTMHANNVTVRFCYGPNMLITKLHVANCVLRLHIIVVNFILQLSLKT